ncbi:MAG: hypothetical protein JWR00_4238 [Rubritepida sp.]|nr:hypothetical protein [Rubritepida sp.]
MREGSAFCGAEICIRVRRDVNTAPGKPAESLGYGAKVVNTPARVVNLCRGDERGSQPDVGVEPIASPTVRLDDVVYGRLRTEGREELLL